MIKGIDPNRPITHQNISNLSTTSPSPHVEHSSLESMKKKGSCFSWVKNYFLSIFSSMIDILSSFKDLVLAIVCFPSKALRPKNTNVESQADRFPKISDSSVTQKSAFGTLVFETNATGKYKTDSKDNLIFKMKKGITLINDLHRFFAENNIIEWYRHQYTTIKDIENELKEMKMHPLEYLYYSVMAKNSREYLHTFLNDHPFYIRWKIHKEFIDRQLEKFNEFDFEETLSFIPDYCKLLNLDSEAFLSFAKERKWKEFIYLTLEKTK